MTKSEGYAQNYPFVDMEYGEAREKAVRAELDKAIQKQDTKSAMELYYIFMEENTFHGNDYNGILLFPLSGQGQILRRRDALAVCVSFSVLVLPVNKHGRRAGIAKRFQLRQRGSGPFLEKLGFLFTGGPIAGLESHRMRT